MPGMEVHTGNPRTQAEARPSHQGQPGLHSETSLAPTLPQKEVTWEVDAGESKVQGQPEQHRGTHLN
jgi:hypothetical protein